MKQNELTKKFNEAIGMCKEYNCKYSNTTRLGYCKRHLEKVPSDKIMAKFNKILDTNKVSSINLKKYKILDTFTNEEYNITSLPDGMYYKLNTGFVLLYQNNELYIVGCISRYNKTLYEVSESMMEVLSFSIPSIKRDPHLYRKILLINRRD